MIPLGVATLYLHLDVRRVVAAIAVERLGAAVAVLKLGVAHYDFAGVENGCVTVCGGFDDHFDLFGFVVAGRACCVRSVNAPDRRSETWRDTAGYGFVD